MTAHQNPTEQLNYPLIGVFLILVVFVFVFFSKTAFQNTNTVPSKSNIVPSITPIQNKKTIHFDKPVSCAFTVEEASYSARMDGNAITVFITDQQSVRHMVVNDDCLYQWTRGEPTGTKRCGVSSMISMGKQLLGSGLMNFDTIIPGLSNPIEQCINVKSVDRNEFLIPQSIKFIESQTKE